MNNSNALAEIQSKYPNCNLLLPAATSVQINPFYKCSVMEVVADTAPNSGDIFSVGKVKTGEDRDGKAVYEEVYSPAKPLLMKLATAAGIQFHPEYTTVTRENTNTYVGKAYGAVRLPDGSYKTHAETKRICLDDEESKYRLEFMDKSIMGIHDWRASKAAAEMFKGEWKQETEPNQYGKYDKYYVIADSDREKYIERSILVNMTLLTEQNRATQQAIADSSATILAGKAEIEEKIAERNNLLKRELDLAGQSALYTSKKQEAENYARQAETEQESVANLKNALQDCLNTMNAMILESANDGEAKQKAEEYSRKKAELEAMQEKAVAYQKAKTEFSATVFHDSETRTSFDGEKQAADERKLVLEKKVAILNESGCVDIENAHCKFLQDAIEAKEKLAMQDTLYADIEARRKAELAKTAAEIEEKKAAMEAIGFDLTAYKI